MNFVTKATYHASKSEALKKLGGWRVRRLSVLKSPEPPSLQASQCKSYPIVE